MSNLRSQYFPKAKFNYLLVILEVTEYTKNPCLFDMQRMCDGHATDTSRTCHGQTMGVRRMCDGHHTNIPLTNFII